MRLAIVEEGSTEAKSTGPPRVDATTPLETVTIVSVARTATASECVRSGSARREATSPIEDSAYQKGVIWCLGTSREREVAQAIAEFTLACLRKIPLLGAVSQKVGFAGVQALGAMDCSEAVAQLTRLRAKVKYAVALKLIEKSLQQHAGSRYRRLRLARERSGG